MSGAYSCTGGQDVLNKKWPLGSTEDICEDYRDNADTFAGHFGAIIQRPKKIQPNAKFFLMTIPKSEDAERTARVEAHADLIYQLAEKFDNCYVMDFAKYSPVMDALYTEKIKLYGHLNPCGYILSAKMIMSYMDYIIRHNIQDFNYAGFIGREELLED